MVVRTVFPLILAAGLVCAQPARADRVDDLSRALQGDPSWRVRLQAERVVAMRAGVEMLLAILDWAGLDRLTPTHRGVRHGMLLAYLKRGESWWRDPPHEMT